MDETIERVGAGEWDLTCLPGEDGVWAWVVTTPDGVVLPERYPRHADAVRAAVERGVGVVQAAHDADKIRIANLEAELRHVDSVLVPTGCSRRSAVALIPICQDVADQMVQEGDVDPTNAGEDILDWLRGAGFGAREYEVVVSALYRTTVTARDDDEASSYALQLVRDGDLDHYTLEVIDCEES